MNNFNAGHLSIGQVQGLYLNKKSDSVKRADDGLKDFSSILSDKLEENVKFSKHANSRLESRNINLSREQLNRLNLGVEKARTKKINESLVMMDNIAFIVNVKNNTVVTAIDQNEDNVFTNIDGAVIV